MEKPKPSFEEAASKLAAEVKKGFAALHPLSEKQRQAVRRAAFSLARPKGAVWTIGTPRVRSRQDILKELIAETRMILLRIGKDLEESKLISEPGRYEKKFGVPVETANWLRGQLRLRLPGIRRQVAREIRTRTKPEIRRKKPA